MAVNRISLTHQHPVQLLRNVFRATPMEQPWEPMQLNTLRSEEVAACATNGNVVLNSSRADLDSSDEYALESSRECLRRRGGYICVDSDDLEDPVQPDELDNQDAYDPEVPEEPLPETIYGFAIASLIQDSVEIHDRFTTSWLSFRALRILSAFLLCGMTFCMQALLIVETKRLVTPTDVKHVRQVYGQYEFDMYKDKFGVTHTQKSTNGFDRGIPGFFNASNFDLLDNQQKQLVCRIPLSQPAFCSMVLFVWTLTTLAHMRDILNTCLRIWNVQVVDSESIMAAVPKKEMQGGDGSTVHVRGLTVWMKVAILGFVQAPRIFMTVLLLWLGGRWLIATVGFGDLLLNCVALEFILNLSSLLYTVLVPYSGKMMVRRTHLPHIHRHEHENCANMFGMLACGFLAALLVWVYMYHAQAVLPDYHFDVRDVCEKFLAEEAAAVSRSPVLKSEVTG